jgi:hypothetical protein
VVDSIFWEVQLFTKRSNNPAAKGWKGEKAKATDQGGGSYLLAYGKHSMEEGMDYYGIVVLSTHSAAV